MARQSLKEQVKPVWAAGKSFVEKWWLLLGVFVLISALAALLAFLVVEGHLDTGFGEYTPPTAETQRSKTLWDWMELLLVPVVLAVGAAGFTWLMNRRQREAEGLRAETTQKLELDAARESALQQYLDRMEALLLANQLLASEPDHVIRDVARARTMTVVRQLDGVRKGLLLEFLQESGLIGCKRIIDMRHADLRGAILKKRLLSGAVLEEVQFQGANLEQSDLSEAHLSGVDLKQANLKAAELRQAQLDEADLRGANLTRARLSDANLTHADLSKAILDRAQLAGACLRDAKLCDTDLTGCNLAGTDLAGADLSGANLTGAKLTGEQLAQAKSLKGAIMPDGTVHE